MNGNVLSIRQEPVVLVLIKKKRIVIDYIAPLEKFENKKKKLVHALYHGVTVSNNEL